jgi:hypothetical protein
MTYYECKICNYKTNIFKDMKKHFERTNICKMEPNLYYDNSIDQNIILSLLPNDEKSKDLIDDERLKDLITKVKSKDYKGLYQNRRRLLMKKLSGKEDDKKCCSYCNKKFNKIQELREHVLIDCFLEEILDKNNNTSTIINNDNSNTVNNITNDNSHTVNNITNNIDNSQKITNNITNNIDNSTTNIIFNVNPLLSFDKSWDISMINTIQEKLEIVCSEILYTKLLKRIFEDKKNINILYDKKNDYGFVYNDDNEYISMHINEITKKSMEKINENLLEINNSVKTYKNEENYAEYAKISDDNEKKIIDKNKNFKNDYGIKNNVVCLFSQILDNKKDESRKIFEKINGNNKIEL